MSVNFFGTECTEPPRTDELFGICDDQDGEKAYSDTTDENKWIAVVKNSKGLAVLFTAIDHCIIILKEGTNNKKHPRFRSIDNEQNKRFFVTYGFRLDVQAEIVIK